MAKSGRDQDTRQRILGIADVYDPSAVEWRRNQLRELLVGGILPRPEDD